MFKKSKTILLFLALIMLSCQSNGESNQRKCYKCTYELNNQNVCTTNLEFEICELRPHNGSLQMVIEIKENCDGNIKTNEVIRFTEDILAEHENSGAVCEEF